MKQALRVAFGFLILWASVLHAEVRIVIDCGLDSGGPIGVGPVVWGGGGAGGRGSRVVGEDGSCRGGGWGHERRSR